MAVGSEYKMGRPKTKEELQSTQYPPHPVQTKRRLYRDSKRCLRVFLRVVYTAGRYQASHFKFVHLIARARNKQKQKQNSGEQISRNK